MSNFSPTKEIVLVAIVIKKTMAEYLGEFIEEVFAQLQLTQYPVRLIQLKKGDIVDITSSPTIVIGGQAAEIVKSKLPQKKFFTMEDPSVFWFDARKKEIEYKRLLAWLKMVTDIIEGRQNCFDLPEKLKTIDFISKVIKDLTENSHIAYDISPNDNPVMLHIYRGDPPSKYEHEMSYEKLIVLITGMILFNARSVDIGPKE